MASLKIAQLLTLPSKEKDANLKLIGYGLVAFLGLVAVFFGVWSRFKGLGTWPLAVDEFYMARAVEKIWEHGVPISRDGEFYRRGILFQYIQFLMTWVWSINEFALRLPAVLFNLAGFPALYLLARKRVGHLAAILLISVFSLSLWEIEFSRFARMYSAFQCAVLWFLYFYHEGFLEGRSRLVVWAYVIAGGSVFLYEGAIFLALLLFLHPFLAFQNSFNTLRHWAITGFIIVLNILFNQRKMLPSFADQTGSIPAGYQSANQWGVPFFLPDLSLLRSVLMGEGLWLFLFVLLALCGAVLSLRVASDVNLGWRTKAVFAIALICSLLQLYGVILFVLAIAFLSGNSTVSDWIRERMGPYVLVLISMIFLYWISLGFWTMEWQSLTVMGDQSYVRKVFTILFHYPKFGEQVLFQWIDVIPKIAVITAFFFLVGILLRWNRGPSLIGNFPFLILLIWLFFLGLFITPWSMTRYSFFLYPLVLLLWFEVACAMGAWVSGFRSGSFRWTSPLFIFMPFLLFLTADDFSISHMRNIDKPSVNFRLGMSEQVAWHYFKRYDYRSPAEYINQHFSEGDVIINAITPVAFYLDPGSYIYYDEKRIDFPYMLKRGGREAYTGLPLIHNHQQLQSVMESTQGAIWTIESKDTRDRTDLIEDPSLGKQYNVQLAATSMDDRIEVFKIRRKPR